MERSYWVRQGARLRLPVAHRTVAGQLADRADRRGRVKATAPELAGCSCPSVTAVANALALLSSYGLLGQDRGVLVLTTPEGVR